MRMHCLCCFEAWTDMKFTFRKTSANSRIASPWDAEKHLCGFMDALKKFLHEYAVPANKKLIGFSDEVFTQQITNTMRFDQWVNEDKERTVFIKAMISKHSVPNLYINDIEVFFSLPMDGYRNSTLNIFDVSSFSWHEDNILPKYEENPKHRVKGVNYISPILVNSDAAFLLLKQSIKFNNKRRYAYDKMNSAFVAFYCHNGRNAFHGFHTNEDLPREISHIKQ